MNLRKLKRLQVFICCFALLFITQAGTAQQKESKKNEKEVATSKWKQYASNPNLTYKQIVENCDKLFAESQETDTAEDGDAKRYARWKFFWQNRLDAKTGKLHSFSEAYALKQRANAKTDYWRNCSGEDEGQPWNFIGPQGMATPHLGRVTDVLVNPNNKNEIYISNTFGGIWKTTNDGASWVCLTDNDAQLDGLGVSSFVVDFSQTPHVIYAAMGSTEEVVTHSADQTFSVMKSPDDGQTFSVVNGLQIGSLNWDKEDKVMDMKIHPSSGMVFITTRYKVLRIHSGTFVTTLLDYSNLNADPDRLFKGFHNITFLEATSSPYRPAPMFITTQGNFDGFFTSALLLKTDNCTDIVNTPTFTNITSNLTTSAFNATTDVVTNGAFTNNSSSWLGFSPWGQNTAIGDGVWEWVNGAAENYFNWSPTNLLQGLCMETKVPGVFGSVNTPITFNTKVDLPVNTRLVIKLKDMSSQYGWVFDPSCLTSGTGTPITLYDSDTDPSVIASHGSNTFVSNYNIPTYTGNISGGHYNRLVFEVQFKAGYIGYQRVKVDDVSLTQPNIHHLVAGYSPATPNTLYSLVMPDFFAGTCHIQKSTDYGSTWTDMGNFSGVNNRGNFYNDMEMSKIDGNRVYHNGLSFYSFYNGNSGAASVASGWGVSSTHADVRSMYIHDNGNGTEDLFAGHDGGLSVYRNGSWECLTCEPTAKTDVFDCSQSFGITSDVHSGDVMVAAFDNGIMTSNMLNYKDWTNSLYADGWFTKYAKRQELSGTYIVNYGGGQTQNILIGGSSYTGGGVGNIRSSHLFHTGWYTKPKTTYEGEYYAGYHIFRLNINQSTNSLNWNDLSGSWAIPSNKPISAYAAHPNNKDMIIGYSSGLWDGTNGSFFYTFNGGTTWGYHHNAGNSSKIFNNYIPVDMCIDPLEYFAPGHYRAWASMSWYGAPGQDRVHCGTYQNGSWTWIDYSDGLPDGPVNAIVYDEQSKTLFAGTDIGVYARDVDDPGSAWRCFSKNMPNSMVMDLEISYCTGKIYATCYGRGAWSADLPPSWHTFFANDKGNTEYIQSNTTWSTYQHKEKTVIVQSGSKLTITGCTVAMGRGKHIVVEPGAVLVVDNATITNECNRMWGGIIIEGNPTVDQSQVSVAGEFSPQQGLVIIRNGSNIDNAYVGVYSGGAYYDGDDFPQYFPGKDGGYVWAENSAFHNCRRSVSFAEYGFLQSSTIDNCDFVADAVLNNEVYTNYDDGAVRYGSKDFIAIWASHGVNVLNSRFLNTINPNRPDLRGAGIVSHNAGYTVDGCDFTDLTRGIHAGADFGQVDNIEIKNSNFINLWRSIAARLVNNLIITNNTIEVGEPLDDQLGSVVYTSVGDMEDENNAAFYYDSYGINISHADIFSIQDNTIVEHKVTLPGMPAGQLYAKFGIIINNTNNDPGITNNPGTQYAYRIYRNTVHTDIGITANQDCRGVQIRCNDLTSENELRGILVSEYFTHHNDPNYPPSPGLLSDQGYCLTNTSPAGNLFRTNPICGGEEHIGINAPQPGLNFTYNYHFAGTAYEPVCYTGAPTNMIINANNCMASQNNACPDPLPYVGGGTAGGGGEPKQMTAFSISNISNDIAMADNRLAALNKTIHDGNSQELHEMLETSFYSSSDMAQRLQDAGPYLSDDVMIKAIKHIPAMDMTDIKKVLIANAGLKPAVWNAMSENYPELAVDNDMIAAQKNQSARKLNEGIISDLAYEKSIHTMNLVSRYSDMNEWSKIAKLYADNSQYRMAVPYYLKANDITSAKNAIDKIENEDYKEVAKLYIDRLENNKLNAGISNSEKEILDAIALHPNTRAGEIARMWLAQENGNVVLDLMPMLKTSNNETNEEGGLNNIPNSETINVHPNPANDYVVIANSNAWGAGAVVSVYDVTGRRVVKTIPAPDAKALQVNTSNWISGVYFVNVKLQNGKMINAKFIINR
ncbi:MAG: T9SS type A sorting domain-containing protein [Flavipsychrobacter sp.]